MAYPCLKSYLPYGLQTSCDLPGVVSTITSIFNCKFYSIHSIEVRAHHIFSSYSNKNNKWSWQRHMISDIKFHSSHFKPYNSFKIIYHTSLSFYISMNRLQKKYSNRIYLGKFLSDHFYQQTNFHCFIAIF